MAAKAKFVGRARERAVAALPLISMQALRIARNPLQLSVPATMMAKLQTMRVLARMTE